MLRDRAEQMSYAVSSLGGGGGADGSAEDRRPHRARGQLGSDPRRARLGPQARPSPVSEPRSWRGADSLAAIFRNTVLYHDELWNTQGWGMAASFPL